MQSLFDVLQSIPSDIAWWMYGLLLGIVVVGIVVWMVGSYEA